MSNLKNKISISVLTSLLAFQTACLLPEHETVIHNVFSGESTGAPPYFSEQENQSCYTQKFQQPQGRTVKSVDILFVTDTSGSLDEGNGGERGKIADGIESFVERIPGDVDYQIAVMLGHGSRSNHPGKLYKYKDNPYVLSSEKMSLSNIRRSLRANLTNVATDNHGDGGEEMLYSFFKGLSGGSIQASRAHGFFRKDAALAVVFITDENDICYPGLVRDPEGLEVTAYKRDCSGVTAENIINDIKRVQKDRPYVIAGIYYNDKNSVPDFGENEFGYGIDEIVKISQGVSVNLADGNYDVGLARIGDLTTIKLELLTDFHLDNDKVDPVSIQVAVDGQLVGHTYQSSLNDVQIVPEDAGMALSVIEVNYCLKLAQPAPTPTPSESPSPVPSQTPSPEPSATPTPEPTASPSPEPTFSPSPEPSITPTPAPTFSPEDPEPKEPSPEPSVTPTPEPSPEPTCSAFGCGPGPIGT